MERTSGVEDRYQDDILKVAGLDGAINALKWISNVSHDEFYIMNMWDLRSVIAAEIDRLKKISSSTAQTLIKG